MAYVLVAVGALMAAAGLYVIGYSALNTRFEEYWTAMTAGATLVAGGIVTVAIGFATRALRDLRAVLAVRPLAAPTDTPAAIERPASLPPVEPELPLEHATEAPTTAAARPLLQPPIVPQLETKPSPPVEAPMPTYAAEPQGRPVGVDTPPIVVAPHEPAAIPPEAVPHDLVPAAEPHDSRRAHPEPEHRRDEMADAPSAGGGRTELPVDPRPQAPHQMPDDWLDRAFADLDQELPIGASPPRGPLVVPSRPAAPALPKAPSLEPAHAAAPSTAATLAAEEPEASPALEPPTSAVIGRYEADGTSYVMYADGSIEAQSSAGVYRFSSMAELKSFIES